MVDNFDEVHMIDKYSNLIDKIMKYKELGSVKMYENYLYTVKLRDSDINIEDIRGVNVATNVIKMLMDQGWIKIKWYRDVPGRPALYVTTKQFLDDFNMKSLSSLPELPEPVEHNNEELLSEVV